MKRPLCKILYLLLFSIASCSQPEPEIIRKDAISVSEAKYSEFLVSYERFINALNTETRNDIKSFIDNNPTKPNQQGRTSIDSNCKCLSTMATCSATGKLSSCCICWDPKTHVGACGVYFGLASCRIEKKENATVKPVPPNVITVYPIQLDGVFDYAYSKNVDVIEIKKALKKLEASAL